VVGTDVYKRYVEQMKYIYNQSNCHTLDRDNLQAQRDSCGVQFKNEEWRFAVD